MVPSIDVNYPTLNEVNFANTTSGVCPTELSQFAGNVEHRMSDVI